MWEFYLAGSETAFRYQNSVVFQVQLVKRIGALPTTRDYMLTDERRLLEQEQIAPGRAWRVNRGGKCRSARIKRFRAQCIAAMRRIDRRGIGYASRHDRTSTPQPRRGARRLLNEALPFRAAPHNLEAEQALLGAMLVNNEAPTACRASSSPIISTIRCTSRSTRRPPS